ncbi:unnamed protein product [Clonostachys chloroleuca]|uniref:Uncharacterized protein n=1 Tax=Clonostachys chloroleuca TaxID=1926264 RepID=A0AA35LPN9_9HYPO|nr:unnamed protein product [Clonostachys chloroleuca]
MTEAERRTQHHCARPRYNRLRDSRRVECPCLAPTVSRATTEQLFDELKVLDDSNATLKFKRMALIMKDDVTDMVHHEFHEFVNAQAEKRGSEREGRGK